MFGALLYLRLKSLENQVRSRTGRLRQPKYLLGAVVTVAYFYFFFFRHLGPSTLHPGLGPSLDPILIGATVTTLAVMIIWVTWAWTFPSTEPALRFTPAEIAFLFPAPVKRRTLIHYSLLSSQVKIFLSAALLGLLWSRRGFTGGGALRHVVGWWILLACADLHKAGANLLFARMKERGWNLAVSRTVAFAGVILFLGAVGFSLWRTARWPQMAEMTNGPALGAYLARQLDAGGLHLLLAPFRLAAGPFLAPDGRSFLWALGPALALVALHYFWVMSLEVSFEEGSIAQAEKRAQAIAARAASGARFGSAPAKARREPFLLAGRGRPEIAFLWKNLLSMGSGFNWGLLRFAPMILLPIFFMLMATHGSHSHSRPPPAGLVVLIGAAMVAFYTLLAGPQLARQDLRSDLANVDLLKTYPLAGWQIVGGEMLAPIAILSALLWLALLAAAWALGAIAGQAEWQALGTRLVLTLCAATVVPPLCALQLLVPNAAMLLFPGWHQATRSRSGGIEMMGQRMIFGLGQLVGVGLLLLPAVGMAALIIVAAQWLVGLAVAAVLATVVVLAIVGGEVWCGVWWLGQRFEKLDLAVELKNP